jgi:hypothetical protein
MSRAFGARPKGRTMLKDLVCADPAAVARRWTPLFAASSFLLLAAAPLRAQAPALPPITVGAGVQTSYAHTDPESGDATDNFLLNSLRLYVNGSVTDKIKVTFNTEYEGIAGPNAGNRLIVLDAVGRFEYSDKFNVWVGRFLPPSDRANLYGPFYAHHWSVYTDGVQDGYPFVAVGRDTGVAYWGQFDRIKVQAGAFDGPSANTGRTTPIAAGRVMVDFWDPEPGYYLNSTYYGGKNLLAIGVAGQVQGSEDSNKAYSVDFLLERKVGAGGAFTVESEYAKYDRLGGYNARYGTDEGAYILASYLIPKVVGEGKFEVLGKFAKANFSNGLNAVDRDYDQKTTEINLNYIIKDFNARVMMFYKDTRYNAVQTNSKQVGVGLQLQM